MDVREEAGIHVGVVGLPELAAALADAGLVVATGPDFRSAAAAITAASRTVPAMPLLIADVAAPGTTPWIAKVLGQAPGALVGVELPDGGARVAGNTGSARRVDLPVGLGEMLSAIGVKVPGSLAAATVLVDGTVSSTGAGPVRTLVDVEAPEPDDDFEDNALGDADDIGEPELPEVAPAAPAPAPVATPAGFFPAPPVAATPPASPFSASPFPAASVPSAVRVQEQAPVPAPSRARPVGPVPHLGRSMSAPAKRGKLILTTAAKGGVGKSTMAMVLAQRAAEVAGLKVACIDGNRGQGDLRTYLRLSRGALPSVYDVATGAAPADVVITPDRLAAVRPSGTDPLSFALVLAPPSGMTDPDLVPVSVYARVVEHLRSVADVVVADTQITEDSDTSKLFDELWVPALAADSYAVGLADLSTPALKNLMERIEAWTTRRGVPTERLFTLLNRVPASVTFDEQTAGDAFSRYSHYLGRVRADDKVVETMGHGAPPWRQPEMAALADRVLLHVTGDPRFAEQHPGDAPAASGRWRLPFLRGRS